MKEFILASQSPRRKQLLEWAEMEFEIIVQSTDESFPETLAIDQVPIHIARQKALAVKKHVQTAFHKQYATMPILAADTIVVMEGRVIGKPVDKEDAVQILQSLSGQWHQVITGVVLLNGDQEIAFSDITDVKFHTLTHEQIVYYVNKYQPYDKAGAYAIQEWIGVVGIETIKGDFYNVMGLPVSRVVKALAQL